MRVPVRRGSVREAADVLQALVDRLLGLYYPGTEEQLRSTVQDALDALEPLSGW